MKLTWFGGSTFRVQTGGQVITLDPNGAPAGIDRGELVSGADRVVAFSDHFVQVDAASWKPRPVERLLDAGDATRPVDIWSLAASGLVLDGADDAPMLLLGGPVPELGRWADNAVVVLFSGDLAARARVILQGRAPRLLALAGSEPEVEAAIDAMREQLDGTGLVALEPGLAVEA